MAVTTGTTTGSSNNNKSPSNPSGGGPGGGSLQAPNRTAPSGGQAGTTKASTASASPQTSAPGKTDKEAPAPTSAPGKTDKVGTSEATKKPGLAGINTQRQQAAFDKQKDLYTQAGGASASMREAQRQATKPTESAKVVDPSRGPNRGLNGISSQTTKTAAGKTDSQAPRPTSAPGKTDKQATPAVAKPTGGLIGRRSGTDTPWGGAQTVAGKTANQSKQPYSNIGPKTDRQDIQQVATGKTNKGTFGSGTATDWGGLPGAPKSNVAAKTDKQPTPSVAKPTPESFIDSLVSRGLTPGSLTVGGSILGAQPTKPSMSQSVAMDPMSYYGPRAGTTPATPASHPNMGIDQAVSQLADIAERAQQGTLLSDFAPPAALKSDLVRGPTRGLAAPSMPDPRLAQMQEQFNRTAAGRGQMGKVADVAAPSVEPSAPAMQSIPSPISMDMLGPQPTVPARTGQITNPMYRDPMAQAQAVRAAVSLGMGAAPPAAPGYPGADGITSADMGGVFNNTGAPMEIDIPGYPSQVAPSQQGFIGSQGGLGVFGTPGLVSTPPMNVPGASSTGQRDDMYGVTDVASPVPSAGAASIAPSQAGAYPASANPSQDDGQPQSFAELSNRYDYEKGQAKQGAKELLGNLFNAITRGDIRGYTPETNDKRPVVKPQPPQQQPTDQTQIIAVARLLALLKQMEQQGGNQSQADLVNSTFN